MVHFFDTCGKFLFRAAVNDFDVGPQTKRRTRGVHSHVSPAYNDHFAAHVNRRVGFFIVSAHQISAGQEFIGGNHSVQIFAFDTHKVRKTCAAAYEYSLIAFFIHERVYRERTPGYDVCFYFDTQVFHVLYLVFHNSLFRQAELRYSVLKHTAGLVQGFEYFYRITHRSQLTGTCQTCRTATYHSHFVAVGRFLVDFHFFAVNAHPVCGKTFQLADRHRLAFYAEHAYAFALRFLRAYAAANGWQRAVGSYYFSRFFNIALREFVYEERYTDRNRARRHTTRVFAGYATRSLCYGFLFRKSVTYFIEIAGTDFRILLFRIYPWAFHCHFLLKRI